MPDKQRQLPWDGRDRPLTIPLIAPLLAFGDSVIDAFKPTTGGMRLSRRNATFA